VVADVWLNRIVVLMEQVRALQRMRAVGSRDPLSSHALLHEVGG
jgi:hypothetical protein